MARFFDALRRFSVRLPLREAVSRTTNATGSAVPPEPEQAVIPP